MRATCLQFHTPWYHHETLFGFVLPQRLTRALSGQRALFFPFIRCVCVGSKDISQPLHVCPPVSIKATLTGHIFENLHLGFLVHLRFWPVSQTVRHFAWRPDVGVENRERVRSVWSTRRDWRNSWTSRIVVFPCIIIYGFIKTSLMQIV